MGGAKPAGDAKMTGGAETGTMRGDVTMVRWRAGADMERYRPAEGG